MKARESGPFSFLISVNLLVIKFSASSHSASRKASPSLINGLVSLSSLFTKSQPNLPFTQVEIPFAGASACGSTFNIFLSFVHTSKLQPTPQYVQTVFVFLIFASRMADSISEMAKIDPYPVSTFLVISIIGLRVCLAMPVKKPASPSIPFSIIALHGQTVEQWPHDTHDDSFIGTLLSQMTRGLLASQSIDNVSVT